MSGSWTLERTHPDGTWPWTLGDPDGLCEETLSDRAVDALRDLLGPEWATHGLPEGVERRSDGTLLAAPWTLPPKGWEYLNRHNDPPTWQKVSSSATRLSDTYWIEVRPPVEPRRSVVEIEGPYETNRGEWRVGIEVVGEFCDHIDFPTQAVAAAFVKAFPLNDENRVEVLVEGEQS